MTSATPGKIAFYLDLIRWDRPAGWLLLLWPTLTALWIAAGGFPGWHLLLVFTLGTVLMRSAGCCINDVADRNFDKHVQRTAQRPITRGAVSVREALLLAVALSLVAFALVLSTNALTIALSLPALAITVLYPYTKRWLAMPQAVLGLAFSLGIPMAFTAVQGQVPVTALWLMAANAFWVIAYDTEYAMVDREDDLRIGIKTSAITLGRWDVTGILVCYALYVLLTLWALRSVLQPTWLFSLVLLSLLAQIAWHYHLIRHRQRETCFRAFRANHWLGLTVAMGVAWGLSI